MASRRTLIFRLCSLALGANLSVVPLTGRAQSLPMLRVGCASVQTQSSPVFVAFLERLAQLGYEPGRNLVFEFVRVPSPDEQGYHWAWREVVERPVDILLAGGPQASVKAALAVAGALPIVMVAIGFDPQARGYVPSLARPAGNATGLFAQIELTAKRLQIMKDALPDVTAVTVFRDRFSTDQWQAALPAASALGIRLHGVELQDAPYDFEHALTQVPAEFRSALMVLSSPNFALPSLRRLPAFALRHRMPAMFFSVPFVESGDLMSYGPSVTQMYRQAAEYVDQIAKGAKPADLPIQKPTAFELAVNLKSAKRLGIKLPTSVLVRADRVID